MKQTEAGMSAALGQAVIVLQRFVSYFLVYVRVKATKTGSHGMVWRKASLRGRRSAASRCCNRASTAGLETYQCSSAKIFRCLECLRDLELLLQTAGRLKRRVKQRRK